MSRIGKKPIFFENIISINYNSPILQIISKNETKEFIIPNYIKIEIDNNKLYLILLDIKYRNFYGLLRTLINNYIYSLFNYFKKEVSAEGVGYKFIVEKNDLILHMGYSHPIVLTVPKEIQIVQISPTKLTLNSKNNIILGDFCQKIKKIRPLEPYKGKGIRINNEQIKLKIGKRGK